MLYRDGLLRYFESQESPRAEEVYVLRSVCVRVKAGPEVTKIIIIKKDFVQSLINLYAVCTICRHYVRLVW